MLSPTLSRSSSGSRRPRLLSSTYALSTDLPTSLEAPSTQAENCSPRSPSPSNSKLFSVEKPFAVQLTCIRDHWRGTRVNIPAVFNKLVLEEKDPEVVEDLSFKLVYPHKKFRSV